MLFCLPDCRRTCAASFSRVPLASPARPVSQDNDPDRTSKYSGKKRGGRKRDGQKGWARRCKPMLGHLEHTGSDRELKLPATCSRSPPAPLLDSSLPNFCLGLYGSNQSCCISTNLFVIIRHQTFSKDFGDYYKTNSLIYP